jgi:hypothetical protein
VLRGFGRHGDFRGSALQLCTVDGRGRWGHIKTLY